MNIYDYLGSPDIAAHCEAIHHVFNPLEMAVIITMSGKSLKQKIAAWQELIDCYPDTPIIGNHCVDNRDSLHSYLREVIAGEEKNWTDFYTPGNGCVYYVSAWSGLTRSYDGADVYSTADKAWTAFCEYGDKNSDNINIIKNHVDVGTNDSAYINQEGEPTDFYIEGGFCNELTDIFIHIPMPFVRGDLVDCDGEPCVLESLMHWDTYSRFKYEDFVSGKIGDYTDMQAGFYYIDSNGAITWEHGYYGRLRYFKGELNGRGRFLEHISQYLKNSDNPIALPWLLNAYSMIKADEDFKEIDKRFIRKY